MCAIRGRGTGGHVSPPPIFWRVWDTISSVPLKIGIRLHHRASKMQTFYGPSNRPGPHAVKASHTNAPPLTDLHIPPWTWWKSGRMCWQICTSPHFWVVGETISNVPRVFQHLFHEPRVLQCVMPNPVCRHCHQSWGLGGGGGWTIFPQFLLTCVSHKGTYMYMHVVSILFCFLVL